MSTFFVDPASIDIDPIMSAAFWITVKATVLLAVAAIAQALLHRRLSASARHLIWTLAIAGLLLLPMLSLVLPRWTVVIRTAAPAVADNAPVVDRVDEFQNLTSSPPALPTSAESVPVAPAAADISWPAVIIGVYAAGVLVMLIQLARQRRSVRRLAREGTDVRDSQWGRLLSECARSVGVNRPVRLLRSRERSMPMAFGTRHPAILIPAIADTWPDDRTRAVVLHELAHVARHDCLTQALAFAACTVYWFHPGAWWVARRLRVERELACDDLVITAGARPREYAGHLLEIAYAFGSLRAPALAVSMARPRHLEGRMLAVLDNARNRRVPALRARLAGAVLAGLLLLPLASAIPTVAAVAPEPDRTPAAAPQQDPVSVSELNALKAHLGAVAHRVVRAAAAFARIPQDGLPGTWEVRPTNTTGTVHLRLVEVNSSSGSHVPIERLEGLTAAQLTGAGGPVQFRMRRDAGTFTFEGVVRNGVGAGTFSFTPDSSFPEELARRGFARPTSREQYQMARHDVGYAFLDELNKQGYAKPQTSELVRAGQHGVQFTYLRDMGALGYRLGSLEPLITLRDHGITPEYVRELADQGYKGLSADGLRQARDHGITPEYVRGMHDAGYGSIPMEQLINTRDHGVTPEFVRELRQLGYGLPINELVRARDHGIDIEFVRGMAALGYGSLPMESLIRLRDHGVTPKYAQDVKALGYDRLAFEDLVTLRDHGLTPDRIRAANARAGTRLPIDMLKSLAAGGIR
jgi:beta-lactamase regulating signal transducer with metallopeptidase domain